MTISIGAVTLSNDLCWLNEFSYAAVGQSVRRLIGGGLWVQSNSSLQRDEIILGSQTSSAGFSGFFTRSQITSLKAYEKAQSPVTFVYESTSLTVIIKANGIDVEPVIRRPNQGSDDWYTGTITMIEV